MSIPPAAGPSTALSPTTLTSLTDPVESRILLDPSAPAQYLRYLIVTALRRKGFEAAEAGALAEMERLLEHHVQRLFEAGADYAAFAGRQQPHAADILQAQDEALATRQLKRESKRRRAAIQLPVSPAILEGPARTTLDLLVDFASAPDPLSAEADPLAIQVDRKPSLQDLNNRIAGPSAAAGGRKGAVPAYAFDWAPGVPAQWMLAGRDGEASVLSPIPACPSNGSSPPIPADEPPPQITSGSMDFVKSTTIVGENIPPELGLVHFLKAGGKRRRGNGVVLV